MSSDSKKWGPKVWYVIHQIAYNFIREKRSISLNQRRILGNFYRSLRFLLPCPSCRDHYSTTLQRYPISKEMGSGSSLFNWTVRAHNLANKGLKKRIISLANAKKIHRTPFNEIHFQEYIRYILLLSTNKDWKNRRLQAICLIKLFPASKSRSSALLYANKENPRDLSGHKNITLWVSKLLNIIKKA